MYSCVQNKNTLIDKQHNDRLDMILLQIYTGIKSSKSVCSTILKQLKLNLTFFVKYPRFQIKIRLQFKKMKFIQFARNYNQLYQKEIKKSLSS